MNTAQPSPFSGLLREGIRSRFVEANGLHMHLLEAGYESPGRPCVLLLHGFPELALSWRNTMLPLARAGFHVLAPDQRGYGRTSGWENAYDCELRQFGMMNLVTDAICLVRAAGHKDAYAVIGHDYGSPVAAYAALIRPDIFRRVVLMASPFGGVPDVPVDGAGESAAPARDSIHEDLAALGRVHYKWYLSTREANEHLLHPRQGLRAFLRAYYHYKSSDWKGNAPFPLNSWTAGELVKIPTYYIMEQGKDMPANCAPFMPSPEAESANTWLPDAILRACAEEFERTGFQGALNWYRCDTAGINAREIKIFTGRTITVPSLFIAGASDWCAYQRPGALDAMAQSACAEHRGTHFIDGAGHWVQQEQPEATNRLLLRFLG